jgi:DNA-binding transcriptional ArsR family regulator
MSDEKMMTTPEVSWDWGSAYDLFASIHVLHQPDIVGLRASWAAGVRSRLPAEHREFLEQAEGLFWNPVVWTYKLPAPKDAATALWALSQIPAAERLPTLSIDPEVPDEVRDILLSVAERGKWKDEERELLRTKISRKSKHGPSKTVMESYKWWASPQEFGERYLAALQSYHMVFFAEEERRIRPALEQAVERGQEMSRKLDFSSLMEELSRGVQLEMLSDYEQVVFAPSYWLTPLVTWAEIDPKKVLLVYGGRPADESLVPGETVPDAMLRGLRALSDPTRMKVLRYLSKEPLTPSKLARRLRLRAPTVIHHLNELRLAGLVHVNVSSSGEKSYVIRSETIDDTFGALMRFLEAEDDANEDEG